MLAASKDEIADIIRNTAGLGENYALRKFDAIIAAAKDAVAFGRTLPGNAVRIHLYIDTYQEYQKHPDTLLEALHKTTEQLKGTTICGQISLLQSLHGIGFLSAVVLIAEIVPLDCFLLQRNSMLTLALILLSDNPPDFLIILNTFCNNKQTRNLYKHFLQSSLGF